MNTHSKALIAATVSALAGSVAEGNVIHLDSQQVDVVLAKEINSLLADSDVSQSIDADYSIFVNRILIDDSEVEIDPRLLMLIAATPVGTQIDESTESSRLTSFDVDCYDACHTNCHGSRSWR